MKCPKCDNKRLLEDVECSQCGIIYKRYEAIIEKKQAEEVALRKLELKEKAKKEIKKSKRRDTFQKIINITEGYKRKLYSITFLAVLALGILLMMYLNILKHKEQAVQTPDDAKYKMTRVEKKISNKSHQPEITEDIKPTIENPPADKIKLESTATYLTELTKKIQAAVVTVITFDANNEIFKQGSGFLLENGNVVTNFHVIKDAYYAEVKAFDGKKYTLDKVKVGSEVADLIILALHNPFMLTEYVNVSSSNPTVAEQVLVVGSPLGLEQTVSEGIISGIRETSRSNITESGDVVEENIEVFQISAPISPGSSGSPVVNIKGEVIGVATFQYIKGQNLNFAIPAKYLLHLLSEGQGINMSLAEWTTSNIKKMDNIGSKLLLNALDLQTHNRDDEAIRLFNKLLNMNYERYGYANCYLGWSYRKIKMHKEALEAFLKAIQFRPDSADAHYGLGLSYVALNRMDMAIPSLENATRLDTKNPQYRMFLGLAYAAIGKINDALNEYENLKILDPAKAEEFYQVITKNN